MQNLTHNKKKIAILGSRGIPAEFGGFETFAEKISISLVQHGFDVTVYCENTQKYKKNSYKGVKLIYFKTTAITGLRSILFDVKCILHSLFKYDVVYMLGYHASFFFIFPWMYRRHFWTNMDGLEWKRSKWSSIAKLYLKWSERFACLFSSHLIADAQGIADHLNKKGNSKKKTSVIAYGAYKLGQEPGNEFIGTLNLQPREYYLVVCRLEPENHIMEIVKGFVNSRIDNELIIVGDHRTGTSYLKAVMNIANDRVKFIGTIFDQEKLKELRFNCKAYIHGHSVGGTNPSLLEAMTCKNIIIAHDNVFNREVTGGFGLFFNDEYELTNIIINIDKNDAPYELGKAVFNRIENFYNWGVISDKYMQLINKIL